MPGMLPGYCETFVSRSRNRGLVLLDFCGMYLFVQIYHTSSGSVRWYYILGVVVGACLMSWLLQKVKKMCKKIYTRKT